MSKQVFIYALKEVGIDEIRYIGKTINLNSRLKAHLAEAKNMVYPNSKCHNWIRRVLRSGGNIEMKLIHKVMDGESWQELEKNYISFYKKKCKLTNTAPGGEGGHLYKKKGKEHSQYGRGKRGFVPWNKGIKHSEATIEKIRNHPKVAKSGTLNGNYGKGDKIFGIKNVNATPIKITNVNTGEIVHLFETRTASAKSLGISERQIDIRLKVKVFQGLCYEKISKADAIHLYLLTKKDVK